jgi:hypothetical protein
MILKASVLQGTNWRIGVPQYNASPRMSIGPKRIRGPSVRRIAFNHRQRGSVG